LPASEDAKTLIEIAIKRFLEEVPALAPLKLVFAVELKGRGDVQLYRVELKGAGVAPAITKEIGEGTSEIQKTIIARGLLARYRG